MTPRYDYHIMQGKYYGIFKDNVKIAEVDTEEEAQEEVDRLKEKDK